VAAHEARVNELLALLASKAETVVCGDDYGDRVLFPYLPWMAMGADVSLEEFMAPLLVKNKYYVANARRYGYGGPYKQSKPPVPRDPLPKLPWLFTTGKSEDAVDFILDARNAPLKAFDWAWEETIIVPDEVSPPGALGCTFQKRILHSVPVFYDTAVPLLLAFDNAPCSGSFSSRKDAPWFYAGMVRIGVRGLGCPRMPMPKA